MILSNIVIGRFKIISNQYENNKHLYKLNLACSECNTRFSSKLFDNRYSKIVCQGCKKYVIALPVRDTEHTNLVETVILENSTFRRLQRDYSELIKNNSGLRELLDITLYLQLRYFDELGGTGIVQWIENSNT